LVDTKKGWKTRILLGFSVRANPLLGLNEKPVRTHDVMVSGIFFVKVNSPDSALFWEYLIELLDLTTVELYANI